MDEKLKNLMELARGTGFEEVCPVNMDALIPLESVREMCSSGTCKVYGTSWSCPPALPDLEHSEKLFAARNCGVLVQTVAKMKDELDHEALKKAMEDHKRRFDTLVRQLKVLDIDFLPLGAGTCSICYKCTYPDKPCRYPDKMYSSMEAYGLMVNDVCTASGMKYNYGPCTMSFTCGILL